MVCTVNKPQKILFLSIELCTTGGIQRYNQHVLTVLQSLAGEHGHQVQVMSLADTTISCAKLEKSGICVETFGRNRLKFVASAIKAALEADICLVGHIHFLPLLLPTVLQRKKIVRILMLYGIEAWQKLPFTSRLGLYQADKLVSISQYTLKRLDENNPLPAHISYDIVPNCVDPILSVSRRYLNKDKQFVLLTVSRLARGEREAKGLDLILPAIKELVEKFPELTWHIVGDGDDRDSLMEEAVQQGVSEHICFMGRVSDERLNELYEQADLFVLPSIEEGFGFVFIEAMAHGLPVVAAQAGAAPEVVLDGVVGCLAQPRDARALSMAIDSLLTDPEKCQSMGDAGRVRVQDVYTFDQFAQKWRAVLGL